MRRCHRCDLLRQPNVVREKAESGAGGRVEADYGWEKTQVVGEFTTDMVQFVLCIDEYRRLCRDFTSRSTLYLLVYTHVKPVETSY